MQKILKEIFAYINSSKFRVVGLFILLALALLNSTGDMSKKWPSWETPPFKGGSDQWDYLVLGYTISKYGKFGRAHDDEYRAYFKNISEALKLNSNNQSFITSRLVNKKNHPPILTAYRPLGYPLFLSGVFKLSGFGLTQARLANVFLFTAMIGIFYYFISSHVPNFLAFISTLFLVYDPGLRNFSGYLLTEVISAISLLLVFIIFYKYSDKSRSKSVYYLMGVSLGLLYLVKTSFAFSYLILVIYFGFLMVRDILEDKNSYLKVIQKNIFFIAGGTTILFPIFAFNIYVTGDYKLFSGTNAANVIHGAYTREYLMGTSVFKIREQNYRDYEKKTGERVFGEVKRAQVGKEILKEVWEKEGKNIIIPLMIYKLKSSLRTGSYITWALRIMFVLGGLLFFKNKFYWFAACFVIGQLLMISVFLHQGSRFIMPLLPLILFYATLVYYELQKKLISKLIKINP